MNLLVDEHRQQKIAGRSHCRPEPPAVRSPSRRPGATKSDKLTALNRFVDIDRQRRPYTTGVDESRKRETSSGAS